MRKELIVNVVFFLEKVITRIFPEKELSQDIISKDEGGGIS